MATASEMSKPRLFLALAALFLSSMCTMGDLVITPIAANIYEVFADSPEWLVSFGVTGPALVGLPFGLLTGFLCDRMDKKVLMVIGFAIFTFSAIFGGAIIDINYWVGMRLLATGVAWGITNTCAMSILADLFTNEDEHGKMVGWYNSVMSIMGAILAAAAGVLAVAAWQNAYLIYWIAAPVLVGLIVFLPKLPPVHKSAEAEKKPVEEVPSGWWTRLIPLTIQVFFVALCYFVCMYMVSVFVADAGIGDEAFTGAIASTMTIATAIGSLIFGFCYKKMKNAVYLPALFIMGICFLVMAFIPSATVALVTLAIMGFFWPFYFCFFYTRCTELVPVSKQGTATGIVALSDGLAATACSYVLLGLMDATGGTSVDVWPIFGITLLVVGVISVVWFFVFRGKDKTPAADTEASDN